MQISELAARTGVSAHALRHYERLGLLQPARRASGYREYTEAMRREVVFIAMSRSIGISLKAIAAQLPAYRTGRLSPAQMIESMQVRVAEIDEQLGKLQAQRRTVVAHIAWVRKQQRAYAACSKAAPPEGRPKAPWPTVATRATPTPTSTPTRRKKQP